MSWDAPMDDGYCDTCQNTGYVDCHCGGDLCVCGAGEIECPVCGGMGGNEGIEDDFAGMTMFPVRNF